MGVAKFTIPANLELSEKEQKGLSALAEYFSGQFQEFAKGKLSENEVIEKMDEKLKSWSEENGISKEKMEKMSEVLKKQGEMLSSLKEGGSVRNVKGLRAAFEKHYDELVDAVKGHKQNFRIKAVSEHTAGKIQTTSNSISTTTSSILSDSVEHITELFMKRRGREYIHDIANVTVVDEVPEILVYDEEGEFAIK